MREREHEEHGERMGKGKTRRREGWREARMKRWRKGRKGRKEEEKREKEREGEGRKTKQREANKLMRSGAGVFMVHCP